MASYVPSEMATRREMLKAIGLERIEDIYRDIPASVRLTELQIPEGMSEQETERKMAALAAKNVVFREIYRGAGAYNHYIPAIVRKIPQKESFLTAYTPYQAEMSQGILQIIFEFQTEVSELMGLPCANASLYDGATAAAEALHMTRDRKVTRTLISAASDPNYIEVCRTYAFGQGTEPVLIPVKDGRTDMAALRELLQEPTAGVFIPQVNFFGLIEDSAEQAKVIHEAKALFVLGVNPIAAAILQSAGEADADIAVAEGQPLGLPLSFGGPYVGLMACKEKLLRKMPGRIVGETTDLDGKRSFVLTLQTREQHIRREKATSNICTNQALCALTTTVYMADLGKKGLQETASSCTAKAHYLHSRLAEIGFAPVFSGEFFHEFVTISPVPAADLNRRLAASGILGPLVIDLPSGAEVAGGGEVVGGGFGQSHNPQSDGAQTGLLWCATECNTKDEMDRLVGLLAEIRKEGAL